MATFDLTSGSITWHGDGETLRVEAWGPDSVRVRAAVKRELADNRYALVDPKPSQATTRVEGDRAVLVNGGITVVLTHRTVFSFSRGYDTNSCALEFRNARGDVILKELGDGGALTLEARHYQAITGGTHRITASFESDPDEKIYGMGQYQQDIMDLKGCVLELAHRNSQASIPFYVSSKNYGFLWHNPAIGKATFGRNRTEWEAESSAQIDYWVTAGGSPADVMAAYADATGHAPRMPEYGLGYWQCKLRYWNQQQVLDVAHEMVRRSIPVDVMVVDFFHWPHMGDYRFDEEFWPDPKAMVDELRSMGIELMVSVWPQVSLKSENFTEFARRGALVTSDHGLDIQMMFEGPSRFMDATDPDARAYWWQICRRNYFDLGIRAFWLDEAEPEYGSYDFSNYRYHLGTDLEIGNIYPQAYARTFFEGQRAAGQGDVVNLVRCAWAGSQRYGALVWSGDVHSTFTDLRRQVVAGIHMGLSGIPWFTTDIGGFLGGNGSDPGFRELLVRWFQFGTFCPVMRLHGDREPGEQLFDSAGRELCHTGADNEPWSYGEDVYRIVRGLIDLRERLRPYTRAVMDEASASGLPVIRATFLEFPDDPVAWDLGDQYMFGPDILVAPVVEADRRSRRVHLPVGASWTDAWTGEAFEGGCGIDVEAPLERIPVFLREGRQAEIFQRG